MSTRLIEGEGGLQIKKQTNSGKKAKKKALFLSNFFPTLPKKFGQKFGDALLVTKKCVIPKHCSRDINDIKTR